MDNYQELEHYSLFISPNHIKRLKSDLWSNEGVPAVLKHNGNRYQVHLNYRGYHVRKFKKKSYDIHFESSSPFHGVKLIHLNAEHKDPSYIRNKLSLDLFNSIGVLAPESRHVFLLINGKKQGIYLQLESFDENFLKKRNLPIGPVYYATNNDANFSLFTPENEVKETLEAGYTRKLGDEESDSSLREFIYLINTTTEDEFTKKIVQVLDIEKYLLWLAGVVCTQNFDGFIHNYSLYKNPLTKLYEPSPWDYDGTWGRDINGHITEYDFVPIQGYNTLTARLLNQKTFRYKYKAILKNILFEHFTVEYLKEKLISIHQLLQSHILEDPFVNDTETFDKEPEVIIDFIKKRRQYLLDHLKDLD